MKASVSGGQTVSSDVSRLSIIFQLNYQGVLVCNCKKIDCMATMCVKKFQLKLYY